MGMEVHDGMMTYSTLPGKAICRLIWNMDREKNLRYVERALSGVPEDFKGKLLEVPVGTGVLSMPVYKELPEADITCLDYSADWKNLLYSKCLKRIWKKNMVRKRPLLFSEMQMRSLKNWNPLNRMPTKQAGLMYSRQLRSIGQSSIISRGKRWR